MPLQSTTGAATYDAYGDVNADRVYIEDVFSTYLYTGNGSTQTITNGINLAGKGGLVWHKSKTGGYWPAWVDTNRGATKILTSNSSNAEDSHPDLLNAFNANGFSVGPHVTSNASSIDYISWTFRKQPKFFDVVTYTGSGANRTISHNLGSVPGCIIVKRTNTAADWQVYHRSLANTDYLVLNSTAASATNATLWNSTTATSTVFSLGTGTTVNASGGTYVAYLFAHDAGGFGASGTDNVISCGSYTGNGSTAGPVVNLGWEPQLILVKSVTGDADWFIFDNMQGMSLRSGAYLTPNTTSNQVGSKLLYPFATGFQLSSVSWVNGGGISYIYIAIRRGPMRTPTSGASVYLPAVTDTTAKVTTGFPVDLQIFDTTSANGSLPILSGKLTGENYRMAATATANLGLGYSNKWDNTGFTPAVAIVGQVFHSFMRAPGFLDSVIYTGNGTTQTVSHNLGVAPELIIFRCRDAGLNTPVMSKHINNNPNSWTADQSLLLLNLPDAKVGVGTDWLGNNSAFVAPTAASFTVGQNGLINTNALGYVAFLFASVPGVSKIGRYTGNQTSQTINCGFTAGARFVLIKRLDFANHWHIFDTARGIVAGNDPFNNIIENQADVTSEDCVDPDNSGFVVNQTAIGQLNASGGTYFYLAIA